MKTHVDIDLSVLEYKKLSEPAELLYFNLNEPLCTEQTPSFLQQSRTIKLPAINIGQVHAAKIIRTIKKWAGGRIKFRYSLKNHKKNYRKI